MDKDSSHFGDVGGDVIGGNVDGSGHIFGKNITFNTFHVYLPSRETQLILQQIKQTPDEEFQIQGSSNRDGEKINNLQDLNAMEAAIRTLSEALRNKEEETGLRIEQVTTNNNLQFSRDELLIKEALIKGSKFYDIGEYVEALSYLDKALSINPNNETAWANKAVTIVSMARYSPTERSKIPEALSYLDKALSINPNNDIVLSSKGWVLYFMKRYDEALSYLDKALSINPNNDIVLGRIGTVLNAMGRHDEALSYLDKALSINPNNSSAWGERGMVLTALGRDTESFESLSRARELGSIEY